MKENEEEIQENSVVVNGEVAYEHYKHVVEDNQVTMRIDKFVSNQIANMTCGMIELRFTFKPMQLILQSMLIMVMLSIQWLCSGLEYCLLTMICILI